MPDSLRILLIDDNLHGLVARRAVLEQQGHKVSVAASGQEGLDLFAEQPFDVVVTDYRMPGLNGQQVIRKLRQQTPELPIVLLSGYVEPLGLTERSTGADIVLSKGPAEVRDLLRAIVRLSRKRVLPKPPGRAGGPPRTAKRKAANGPQA